MRDLRREGYPIAHIALLRGERWIDRLLCHASRGLYSGCALILEQGMYRRGLQRLEWQPLERVHEPYDLLQIHGMNIDRTFELKGWLRSKLVWQSQHPAPWVLMRAGADLLLHMAGYRSLLGSPAFFGDVRFVREALHYVGIRLAPARTPDDLQLDPGLARYF